MKERKIFMKQFFTEEQMDQLRNASVVYPMPPQFKSDVQFISNPAAMCEQPEDETVNKSGDDDDEVEITPYEFDELDDILYVTDTILEQPSRVMGEIQSVTMQIVELQEQVAQLERVVQYENQYANMFNPSGVQQVSPATKKLNILKESLDAMRTVHMSLIQKYNEACSLVRDCISLCHGMSKRQKQLLDMYYMPRSAVRFTMKELANELGYRNEFSCEKSYKSAYARISKVVCNRFEIRESDSIVVDMLTGQTMN